MFILRLLFLFNFIKLVFTLNNNTQGKIKDNFIYPLPIIQNIPVENNIPLIIQEIDKNYINQKISKNNPTINHIIIPEGKDTKIEVTNTSIKINTTNIDPMCTKECCMGCQVQFTNLASQKNCIINICKCKIIEINYEENNNNTNSNTNNKKIKEDMGFMLLNIMNINDINITDMNGNNYEYYYYWLLIFFFIVYESYIFYNINSKNNKFNIIIDNNNLVVEKDKATRINDYMELLNDDEELIESLI